MCIFCGIIKGTIPSYKVYEDDDFIAFLDINQATIGHTLVVPKQHYDNIFSLDDEIAERLGKIVVFLANHLKTTLDIENINILNNTGYLAGQTVNHLHIHLIPRYKEDDVLISFKHHSLTPKDYNELISKLTLL